MDREPDCVYVVRSSDEGFCDVILGAFRTLEGAKESIRDLDDGEAWRNWQILKLTLHK